MAYEYIAFFPHSVEVDLEKLKANLKSKFEYTYDKVDIQFLLSNDNEQSELEITFTEFDYKFFITLQNNQEVLKKAKYFATNYNTNFADESYDVDKLLTCHKSLELSAYEDYNMDYFNCCVYILEEFEKLNDDIFIFLID